MADELDKTIEELEAEVLDELEEANGADAPKKNAGKAETMDKINLLLLDTFQKAKKILQKWKMKTIKKKQWVQATQRNLT